MFDNDMYILDRCKLFNSYSKVFIISNSFISNELKISKKVIQFKIDLIDKINKLIPNSVVLRSQEIRNLLSAYKYIDVIYPGIGHNLDLINKYSNQNQIIINYIYREEDLRYWDYAKSGFYKFKTSFYKINMI